MKILILGAKGSLGQTFVDLYKDEQVTAWDRAELDITSEPMVIQKITELKPDLVINCAAYNNVDKAEEEWEKAELLNGLAVGFISRACKNIGATLVHYSTAQVFDGIHHEGYNEDGFPKPVNAYGQSKLLGEKELKQNIEQYYLIRTCWLYGHPAAGKKSFTDIMLDLGARTDSVNAVNDEFGNPTYVVDLAHATRALIEEKKPFGIYHLTNSGVASRYNWAREIFNLKNIRTDLNSVDASVFKRQAVRPKYEVLKNTKFIELRPWQEALKEYLT